MRLPRWLVPATLLVAGAAGSAGVAVQEAAAARPAQVVGGAHLATPVLSVRRVPTLVAGPVADRRLRADLEAWAAAAPAASCAVVQTPDGDIALDLRGDMPMRPASTQKLLTASAALLELGADTRFRTTVVGAAPVSGTVTGDVALVGGGDPVLATADYAARFARQPQTFTDLDSLAAAVAAGGVQHVTGAVLGDASRYDQERSVPGWPARYVDDHEVGPLSGLSVNDGFAAYPTPGAYRPIVPADDPAAQAAAVFTVLLQAHGVQVDGGSRSGPAPTGTGTLAAIESPPLRTVVAQMLEESDNTTAELLTKELGRAAGQPSTAGGRARITDLLTAAGLDLDGATVVDGSGLSLDDRVTCDLLVDALTHPGTGAVVRAGLAVAGRSGTLEKRFLDTPLVGRLRAKTGSLNTVTSLAGVVQDDDGALPFAYIVNVAAPQRVDGAAVIASQQRLGEILLNWPRTPDLATLGPRPPSKGR
jgi:D-alanyl-D-alanine carboxypeptidase/D-alanyl-D-alanine-endopeptidase (penicillin-binding protein 4)